MIRMLKPLAALAVILAQPAQAQDTSERDRAMVKMLEESYAAAPDPALKYLLAESYARLGQPAQSAKALKAVVDSGQPFLPPPDNAMWNMPPIRR